MSLLIERTLRESRSLRLPGPRRTFLTILFIVLFIPKVDPIIVGLICLSPIKSDCSRSMCILSPIKRPLVKSFLASLTLSPTDTVYPIYNLYLCPYYLIPCSDDL